MNNKVRDYDPADLKALYEGFVSAFSDYFVTFQPGEEQFKRRISHKLNIVSKYSPLAWKNGKVVSFAFHTLNSYQNLQTLYNGGTGTIPVERRNQLASELLMHTAQKANDNDIERILLEVIEHNTAAVNLYSKLGYEKTRLLKCFKLKNTVPKKAKLEVLPSNALKSEYEDFGDFEPSFIDSSNQLKFNLSNETILEAYLDEELAGYIIFQSRLGRISQIAVANKHRGKDVGTALINAAQKRSAGLDLTIMNIPEYEYETIHALERLGFENELNQIEMELKL